MRRKRKKGEWLIRLATQYRDIFLELRRDKGEEELQYHIRERGRNISATLTNIRDIFGELQCYIMGGAYPPIQSIYVEEFSIFTIS